MELDDVAAWPNAYVGAWESNDPNAIGELFTEDAVYCCVTRRFPSPYEEVLRGRDAIVAAWLEDPDLPGSWVADYQPDAIASDLAVATGTSTYFHEGGETVRAEYSNAFFSLRRADALPRVPGVVHAAPDRVAHPPPGRCRPQRTAWDARKPKIPTTTGIPRLWKLRIIGAMKRSGRCTRSGWQVRGRSLSPTG